MSQIEALGLSIEGTWIDGYLPGMEKIRRLAQKYQDLDLTREGVPMEYGFTSDNKTWLRMDYFASLASAVRDKFDRENVAAKKRFTPCLTWMVKIDKKPSDERALPLYEEYLADPRKDDYCHLINMHEEHLYRECDSCTKHLIEQLGFQVKPENSYQNFERFEDAAEQILTDYVNIIAVPQQHVDKHLKLISDNAFFSSL